MIRWDESKNYHLKRDRHMSFERIAEAISNGDYLEILRHPKRRNQQLFVLRMDNYVWAVPFVVEADGETLFLKTAFPSRKFNRRYGESGNE